MDNQNINEQIEKEYNDDINPQLFSTCDDENLEDAKPISWDDIVDPMNEAKIYIDLLKNDTLAFRNLYSPAFSRVENLENNFKTLEFSVKELENSYIRNLELHSKVLDGKRVINQGEAEQCYTTNIAIVKIVNDYKLMSCTATELRRKMIPLIINKMQEFILKLDETDPVYKELEALALTPDVQKELEELANKKN